MIKPPYAIPTMLEIDQLPLNGYEAISSFSGCGGSSLGYRMGGFKMLWANEFIKAAQDSYKANFPDTFLDHRDIRDITVTDLLKTIDRKPGEIDLLDGSPPCNPFSTSGNRHKSWNKIVKYGVRKQRVDDLFFEYVRILDGVQPRIFVAENVTGLIKGAAKGYFKEIILAMKNAGYRVKAKVLYANWLGVATTRPRLFFIGIRNDLELEPVFPKPLHYQYTIRNAIPWIDLPDDHADIPPVETRAYMGKQVISKHWEKLAIGESDKIRFNLRRSDPDKPAHTLTAKHGGGASITHPYICRRFSIAELKRISSFPDDFILTGSYAKKCECIGMAVVPFVARAIAETLVIEVLGRLNHG